MECISVAYFEDVDRTMDEGFEGLGELACVKGCLSSYMYWKGPFGQLYSIGKVCYRPQSLYLTRYKRDIICHCCMSPHCSIGPITCQ